MDKHVFLDFKGFESLLELEFGILETLFIKHLEICLTNSLLYSLTALLHKSLINSS